MMDVASVLKAEEALDKAFMTPFCVETASCRELEWWIIDHTRPWRAGVGSLSCVTVTSCNCHHAQKFA